MSLYKLTIRPILFLFPPEMSHAITMTLLRIVCKIPLVPFLLKAVYVKKSPLLETKIAGLTFPNPVGLAAGFDKNALFYREMGYLGFGFVEVGTVTPLAQPGNEKPRLIRLTKDKALINRMGFNNFGMEAMAKRLKKKSQDILVGGNIGKNKHTPNKDANSDYEKCFDALFDEVNYFVVNVSSPNTPGLRSMQEKEPLEKLLLDLQAKNNTHPKRKPIFLKIAPDLTKAQLDDIIAMVISCKIDAVVATNTTLSRDSLRTLNADRLGSGGISGRPLTKKSTAIVKYLHEKSQGAFPIIASGGIHSVADAMAKLDAGAAMVELYTGFIYEGPLLARKINKAIIKRAKQQKNKI